MSTLITPSSTTSSCKKSSKRPPIVVRQTLTSKLRAERGDKLQFIKDEIEKRINKTLTDGSKESLKATDNFKIPKLTVNNSILKSQNTLTKSVNKVNFKNTNSQSKTVNKLQTKSQIHVTQKENSVKKNLSAPPKEKTSSSTNPNKSMLQSSVSKDDKLKNRSSVAPTVRTTLTSRFYQNRHQISVVKDDKLKARPSSVLNSKRPTLSKEKFSLLPNQIKVIPESNEKPRRQTLMPRKNDPVKKVPNKSAPLVTKNLKPTLKNPDAPKGVKKSVTVKSPLRKSLTAMHFKRTTNRNRNSVIHRTVSWSNGLSPIRAGESKVTFCTPSMAQRRSVAFATPMSGGKYSISPYSIIGTPTSSDLKRRLALWLEKRKKPLDSFHHLKCFGIHSKTEIEEENKENFELYIPDLNDSYENLNIKQKTKEDVSKNVSVANDALYDLHKLILDGYPRDQCEAWLELIVSRFEEVQEGPQYWECRAALEESRGNFQSALDCYEKAITQGAEIQKMENPLDNLLEKFSVLNISQDDSKITEQRSKEIKDARNVFKSSIINFAIQERDKKQMLDNDCKFVATPVRRSTRIRTSTSAYSTTPNIKICSTLKELDSPVRKSLHFQTNRGFKH